MTNWKFKCFACRQIAPPFGRFAHSAMHGLLNEHSQLIDIFETRILKPRKGTQRWVLDL